MPALKGFHKLLDAYVWPFLGVTIFLKETLSYNTSHITLIANVNIVFCLLCLVNVEFEIKDNKV